MRYASFIVIVLAACCPEPPSDCDAGQGGQGGQGGSYAGPTVPPGCQWLTCPEVPPVQVCPVGTYALYECTELPSDPPGCVTANPPSYKCPSTDAIVQGFTCCPYPDYTTAP